MTLQYLVDIWNQINAIIVGHPAKKDKFYRHIRKVIREAENYGKYLRLQWQQAKKAGLVSYDENKKVEKEWTWWTAFSNEFDGQSVYFNDDEVCDVRFYIKGKAKPDPLSYLHSMIWGARGQKYEGLELLDYQFTLLTIIYDAQNWQAGREPIYFNYSLQEMGDNLKDRLCCAVWNHLVKNIDSYSFRDVPRTIETAMRAVRAELDKENAGSLSEPQEKNGQLPDKPQQGFLRVQLADVQTGAKSASEKIINTQGLKTLGDYSKAAKNPQFSLSLLREGKETSHYETIKIAFDCIKELIKFARTYTFPPDLSEDPWEVTWLGNTEYSMKNIQLFYAIELMEFAIKYQDIQSIYELYPEWEKRPDTNILVFTYTGLSYLEAVLNFAKQQWGINVIYALQIAYREHRKAGHIINLNPFEFLNETPKVDKLEINPEPDIVIKTWFDDMMKATQNWIQKYDVSIVKAEEEFNRINKQLEYEWNLWKRPQETDGQGEKPSDLIDLAKAVGLYHRSRAQIKRDIKDGKIKDYRKIEKGKHWISRSEADSLYISK